MHTFEELRSKYKTFIYKSFKIDESDDKICITYDFETVGLSSFSPCWTFGKPKGFCADLKNNKTFKTMVFSLGMVELISYWKISCPERVIIKAASLTAEQIRWWKEQYFYGLGEFLYTNRIDISAEDLMTMECEGEEISGASAPLSAPEGCLIPVGGGKDSAVTIELLSEQRNKNRCYIINPRKATTDTATIGSYSSENVIAVHRTLDKNMLSLNKEGYLNGHTPFSAIVAFSATIAAYLNNLKYIALSNESSANESTVLGSTVNHQYSKSFKFEEDFHNYESKYISSGTYYFSLLRPLSEYQIAWYFSRLTQYHRLFRSCNAGSKQDIWCCKCPKCLFVFLILSPFLSHDYLCNTVFGEDITNNPDMLNTFKQLIGITEEKPFECVGSREEVNTAITETIKRMENGKEKLPYLFEYYKTTNQYTLYSSLPNKYTGFYDKNNLLPTEYEKIMKNNFCNTKEENLC